MNAQLHWKNENVNPCLPLGSSIEFDSWMHVDDTFHFYRRSDPKSTPYSVTMLNNETAFDFQHCSKHVYSLLNKETNHDWCEFQMDGRCGFAGIYQPPMPQVSNKKNKFIATSNFVDVFQFLRLGKKASVSQIGEAAERVCGLGWEDLKEYNKNNEYKVIKTEKDLAQYCFRSVFVYQLLHNGWEFGDNYVLTAKDVIRGQKLGWALGSMLYEINTLPWTFHPELLHHGPSWFAIILFVVLATLIGSLIGLVVAMSISENLNKSVRNSLFVQNHPSGMKNALVRSTPSLPGYGTESCDDESRSKQSASSDAPIGATAEEFTANERTILLVE